MGDEQSMDIQMPAEPPKKRYMFLGSYDHTLDAKGRIIIPNAYRKPLGETFTITIGLDDKCIALYPDDAFEAMIDKLYQLNSRIPSIKRQQDHVTKYSFPGMQADQQGRLLLPAKIRQYVLGDAKELEISGARDHVRVVSREVGLDEDTHFKEHLDEILDDIAQHCE